MLLYKKLLNNFINNIVYQIKIKEKYFTLFPKIKYFLVKNLAIYSIKFFYYKLILTIK